jgi:SAM-dependent methyltransferase
MMRDMSSEQYDSQYFARYLTRGRLTRAAWGEKRLFYKYWVTYLKKRLPPGASVLEVGCGLGFMGRLLAEKWKYTGLDISQTAVDFAKSNNQLDALLVASAVSLPIRQQTMDAVVAFDVVEHLHEPRRFFAEACRVLKPGGTAIVCMPNPESFGVRVKKNSLKLTPTMRLDPTHVSLFPRGVWNSLAREEGFEVVRAGSDCLWDLPYVTWIPLVVQKIIFVPLNAIFQGWIGLLPWNLGENTIIIFRKASGT